MVEVQRRIRHNGRRYTKGDVITDITEEQAVALVENGAADWLRMKPQAVAAPAEPLDQYVDVDDAVKQYHKGFGRYDIPGVGMVQGRDAAIEALKSQQGKS